MVAKSTTSASSKKTARRPSTRSSREQSRARIIAAATELVRERAYPELSVGEIMEHAGSERTLFYRHFDDLADLLLRAANEAIVGLYDAQVDLSSTRDGSGTNRAALRAAIEPCVFFYERHGPLLRALNEAAATEKPIASGQEAMHRQFDQLVAESLAELPQFASLSSDEVAEIAHALNLLNVSYLLDAFGRKPRVSTETALRTLTEIWAALIHVPGPDEGAG